MQPVMSPSVVSLGLKDSGSYHAVESNAEKEDLEDTETIRIARKSDKNN